jgi:hypothetical protein
MPVTPEDKVRYNKTWKEKNPDAARESHRKAQLRWRQKNRERVRETVKKWVAKNPEKMRSYKRKQHYREQYGITLEERDQMLTAQGNCCACCGGKSPKHKMGWVVDHCHKTGTVRGILCQPCNLTLGKVAESIDHLKAIISYIEKHNEH